MKVRLLKKLRKRAYKEIGIVSFVTDFGDSVYNVGFRKELTFDYCCKCQRTKSLDDAKVLLNRYRRQMILYWVSKQWEKRCIKRLLIKNKEIIKL